MLNCAAAKQAALPQILGDSIKNTSKLGEKEVLLWQKRKKRRWT